MEVLRHIALASLLLGLAGVISAQPVTAPVSAKAGKTINPANRPVAPRTVKDEKTGFSYRIEAVPAWVVPAQERAGVVTPSAAMHYRLIDEQLRVDDHGGEDYNHVVRVVDDAAGLSTASQIELEFDPSCQTLALHHLDVVRDGMRSTRLTPQRIQLLQRETQLERRMVDGRVTLAITLDDIRRGDAIDFAYTVRGSNPIFGQRYVHTVWLGSWRGPVATQQIRLLAPVGRTIGQRVGPSDTQVGVKVEGGWRETLLRRESVPQIQAEDGTPYGELLAQQAQFSEFTDWGEVARWGSGLFSEAGPQPLLERQAEAIRTAHAAPTERVLAALDFVQRDIRYFGSEIGVNSHRPATPDQVLSQRWGDCKDKTRLLVALLRRLDIPAAPVLVSQGLRRDVALMLPSPEAFDHAIARVDLDGRSYWLDGTRSHQSGPLDKRQAGFFLRGLLLRDDSSALASLPEPWNEVRVRVADELRFTRIADDPALESRITYRGDHAEALRSAIAERGPEALKDAFAEPYVKAYPKIVGTSPLIIEESTDDDAITVVQRFRVVDFWRFPEQRALVGDLLYWNAIQPLVLPKSSARRQALGLNLPGLYLHDIGITFPEPVFREPSSSRFEDSVAGISIRTSMESSASQVRLHGEAHLGTDRIDAAAWHDVATKLPKMISRLGSVVAINAVGPVQQKTLPTQARELDMALRSGKVKAKTQIQRDAHLQLLVLGAQIDGGRLPPPLLAQALNQRGIQHDNLGQADIGRADFERAMALAPGNLEYVNAAAVNAMALGQYDRALELTGQVLARTPRDSEALLLRARALYFKGDMPVTSQALDALLQDKQARRSGYGLIWWSLAQRRQGQRADAVLEHFPREDWPSEWPRQLVEFTSGQMGPDELLAAARQQKSSAEALTEAYFFIGESLLCDGQPKQAADYWRKAVDQGVVEYVEDQSARLRLASLH